MATPAQILANRANAQLSTGPVTEEGKRTCSMNACRHGLTGTQIVMPGEDADVYEELRLGMHDSYMPANDPEKVLVDQIAANAWRLMRAQRVETAFLAKLTEDADDPSAAIAAAMLDRPKDLARIARYITAAQNAWYKAMAELAKLQKQRALAEEHDTLLESIGSVSQRTPVSSSTGLQPVNSTAPAPPAALYETPEFHHDAPSALRL